METKKQSSQLVGKYSPRPENIRRVSSNVKVMLTVFFYIEGVVHHEFLRQWQTVSRWYYLVVLKHLRENIWTERSQLW
jgi:hypothetical protein